MNRDLKLALYIAERGWVLPVDLQARVVSAGYYIPSHS